MDDKQGSETLAFSRREFDVCRGIIPAGTHGALQELFEHTDSVGMPAEVSIRFPKQIAAAIKTEHPDYQ